MFKRTSPLSKLDKWYVEKSGVDVITTQATGLPSQKPFELYELIERIVPRGPYIEIFARKVNWREEWVSCGNEALELKFSDRGRKRKTKQPINYTTKFGDI